MAMKIIEESWLGVDGPVDGPATAIRGEVHIVDDETGWEQRVYVDNTPLDDAAGDVSGELDTDSFHQPEHGYDNHLAWDVWALGNTELVDNLQNYTIALAIDDQPISVQRAVIAHQLELPSWDGAPQQLKDEVYAFLVETRGQ